MYEGACTGEDVGENAQKWPLHTASAHRGGPAGAELRAVLGPACVVGSGHDGKVAATTEERTQGLNGESQPENDAQHLR